MYLHTRADGKRFSPSRLRAKVKHTMIRDMLFADDAAVAAHSQTLMDCFANAWTVFGLPISLKKIPSTDNHIAQYHYQLEVVDHLGSILSSKLPLYKEVDEFIGLLSPLEHVCGKNSHIYFVIIIIVLLACSNSCVI